MLSNMEFIQQSLELNLFYLRLFKEHMIFFEASLSNKEHVLAQQAEGLKCELTALLGETISLAQGVISPQVLASGELVTQYTIDAERATEFYTGIHIDTELTGMELSLCEITNPMMLTGLADQVASLNQRVISLVTAVADFKHNLLQSVESCQVFIAVYPSLIRHTFEETNYSLEKLYRTQNWEEAYSLSEITTIEAFWNHVMAEHAEFLRGFLDPSQKSLFKEANDFVKEFEELTRQAQNAVGQIANMRGLNLRTLDAVNRIRDFKATGTEGLLQCKVRAIATPLLSDHVFREASHYVRLLNRFIAKMP